MRRIAVIVLALLIILPTAVAALAAANVSSLLSLPTSRGATSSAARSRPRYRGATAISTVGS